MHLETKKMLCKCEGLQLEMALGFSQLIGDGMYFEETFIKGWMESWSDFLRKVS